MSEDVEFCTKHLVRLADGYAELEPIASGSERGRSDAILREPLVNKRYRFRRRLDVCLYLFIRDNAADRQRREKLSD